MREHEVGYDVARGRAVAIEIEEPLDRHELATRTRPEGGGLISHVLQRPGAAGHEPAAEAPAQRVVLIDGTRHAGGLGLIGACRAEHQKPGHAERVTGAMTAQTLEGALELRGSASRVLTLIEGVEHDARRRVVRRNLEDRRVAHPPDRDAIVEVDRTGTLLVDKLALQAGTREDQQLRINWNLQCIE